MGGPRHGKAGVDAGNSCDRNWERRIVTQIDGWRERERERRKDERRQENEREREGLWSRESDEENERCRQRDGKRWELREKRDQEEEAQE